MRTAQCRTGFSPSLTPRARPSPDTTWLAKLRAPAKIKFDEAAIKKFVQANEFDANAAAPQHGVK